jgi:lysophospholipase L1-like esterase
MGQSYPYLISSRLWYDHPGKNLHFINRGVSGNKVSDLAARWQQDTIDLNPDVLSILIGVNDLNSFFKKGDPAPVSAAIFESGYRDLLHLTREKLPATKVVICEPFLLPVGNVKTTWSAWSAEMSIRQAITQKLAAETGACYVPLQEAFNEACRHAPPDYWIWDGIHPMPAGHELIARRWIGAAGKERSFSR